MAVDESELSIDLDLNVKYLMLVGIWPLGTGTPLWKRFLMSSFFFVGVVVQTFSVSCEVLDIILNIEDLEEITDNMFSVVMNFQSLFKQIYISYQIKHFQHLVESINSVFYKAKQPFKTQKKTIIQTSLLYTKAINFALIPACCFCAGLYPLIPLTGSFGSDELEVNATAKRLLPYSIWFPVDKYETPYYEVLYLITTLNAVYIAIYISSTDTFIICLIIHTFKQFDILQFLFRNIKEDASNRVKIMNMKMNALLLVDRPEKQELLDLDVPMESEEIHDPQHKHVRICDRNTDKSRANLHHEDVKQELHRSLIDCIKKHQQLLEFSDYLNKALSPFFFELLGIDVFILCIMALHLTVVPVLSFKFASALTILFSALNILALICWCSGELLLKSQAVGDAAYEADWFDAPQSVKRSLWFVMARAKRPCKISAGKLMVFNMESYFVVLKTSYSYFTVLQRVYHG